MFNLRKLSGCVPLISLISLLITPVYSQTPIPTSATFGQDEDIKASSIEEIPSSTIISIDEEICNKFRRDKSLPLRENSKPWKFNRLNSLIQKNVKNGNYPNLSSDDSGNYWLADNILYDGKSNRIIFQASLENGLEISKNGNYLNVRGPSESSAAVSFNGIYKIPEMKKITLSNGWIFSKFLGQGRFAIVLKKRQQGIVDLENPIQIINIDKDMVWGTDDVFESLDGNTMLHQEANEMVLYNLPGFSIKQKYPEIGSGTPIINSTGTIIGCNRGICYLVNTITGITKSYGINGDNCSDLVEGSLAQTKLSSKKDPFHYSEDVTTKIISLSTLKTVKKFYSAESNKRFLPPPINGKSCGIYYAVTPKDSPDVWLVIDQFNSHDIKDRSGQAMLMRIGEDLKIKQILHFPKTINGASWDDDSHSIMGKTFDDEYFQITTTPK